MIRTYSQLTGRISFLLLILGATIPGMARGESYCLRTAEEKIHIHEHIVVKKSDGSEINGSLLSISPSQSLLSLYLYEKRPTSVTLGGGEITSIAYRRKGKIRPLFLAVGAVVGAVTGMYIEAVLSNGHIKLEPYKEGEFWHGDVIGGVSGLAIGLVLSLIIPKGYQISCP